MKKLMRVSLSALAVGALPAQGFAEETAVTEDVTAKAVTPYGLIGSTLTLSTSEDSNPLNLRADYLRTGLTVSEGIAKGQIELQYAGDSIGIRRAHLGLELDSGTTITLGRYRPGGADGWGMDASEIPNQFSRMDGIHFAQNLEFGDGVSVDVGLGVANALLPLAAFGFIPETELSKKTGEPDYLSFSGKTDRALLFSLAADVKGASLKVYHGMENNAFIRAEEKATTDDDGNETAPGKPAQLSDYTHTEVSLGYDLDGISGGVWYEGHSLSDTKSITKDEGGAIETETLNTSKIDVSRIGLGVQGDSTYFGVSGLLQEDDKLFYGLSYVMTDIELADDDAEGERVSTLEKLSKESDYAQFVAGVGYGVGGFTIELNVDQKLAEGKIFKNAKGEKGQEDSALRTYIKSYYSF